MEVVTNIVYSYLEKNRRITIPTLGTFLTKGGRDTILFSEFMKSDDGVLQSLLIESGLSDEEASSSIEQFVSNIRAALSDDGFCELLPLGKLYTNEGFISFSVVESEIEVVTDEEDMVDDTVTPEEEAKIVENIFESLSSYIDDPVEVDEEVNEAANEEEELEEEEKPRYDTWLIAPIIAIVFAIIALLYGVVVEWQVGNISFGRAIDGVLISIFG